MPIYTVTRTSAALSTTNDLVTIVAGATKPLRIVVVDIKGLGTSSAANEVLMARSSGGVTPGGGLTPRATNTGAASAAFSAYTTWGTQPSLGNDLWRFGVNANGGQDKFVAVPGGEFSVPVTGQVSIRSVSGTSNVSIDLMIEEIDG